MKIPDWYSLVILSLASFRSWRLVAEDDITDRLRRYVTALGPKWQEEGDPVPEGYRVTLGKFIDCPWCLGAWLCLGWWAAWEIWPHGTLVVAVPFALSGLVPLVHKLTSQA